MSGSSYGSPQRGRGGRSSNSSNRGRGRSNSTRSVSNNTTTSNSMNADPNAHIIQLLQQLQNTKSTISTEKIFGKPTIADVIIDIGASHHMTENLSPLSDVTGILSS